jgi:hypothetical protein
MDTTLRDLLNCLCRHALTLIDPSLRQLSQLPDGLAPTIFLRQPGDVAIRRLLDVSSDQNVLCGSHFLRICSPLVVFTARPASVPALRLTLPASGVPYRRIPQPQIEELCHIQRKLLRYRLTRHQQVAASGFDAPSFGPETRVIAHILGACVEGDKGVQQEIMTALQQHDETAKVVSAQSPEAAVLEALLVLIHERHTKAYVGEIARVAKGILFGRQETIRFSGKAVGSIITDHLGLHTKRQAPGYELRLDSATCLEIHRLARYWGVLSLLAPRSDCSFCTEALSAAISSVADEARAQSTQNTHVHPCETLPPKNASHEEGL